MSCRHCDDAQRRPECATQTLSSTGPAGNRGRGLPETRPGSVALPTNDLKHHGDMMVLGVRGEQDATTGAGQEI